MSVLHIAHSWGFASIQRLAARKLHPLASEVDHIICGHAYNLPDWLLPAYIDVCTRAEWLTLDEGRRLGVDDTIRVGLVRERLRQETLRTPESVRVLVVEVFSSRLPNPIPPFMGRTKYKAMDMLV